MEKGVREIRAVPSRSEGLGEAEDGGRRFTAADLDAARELAEYHRLLASELPPKSQLRGLVLRCAGHWSRLGAIPRNGLSEVDRPGSD